MIIVTQFTSTHDKGQMIRVDPKTALLIIKSLVEQIRSESPNAFREELRTEQGEYFSIAVLPVEAMRELRDTLWKEEHRANRRSKKSLTNSRSTSRRGTRTSPRATSSRASATSRKRGSR